MLQRPEPHPDRPDMPASYGIARATGEGMLPWRHVSERMAGSRNYWIATARPDGRPHVAPVWGVWLDGALLFATDRASRKGRNLAASPAVAVHLESGDDVVILEGTAAPVSDRSLLERFADAYEAKYSLRPDIDDATAPAWRVDVRLALAWLESDFTGTATRWGFDGGADPT